MTSDRIAVATLILVALMAAAPLWGPGIVNTRGGGDSPFLLQRTHQMLANLRAGAFPVRWMPDAAYGLGYPFFSYYSALPYYLAGLLALAGLDLLTAVKLVQTLGFIASALTMYGWMRGMTKNRWAAWLAAVAYTVAPFHLVNVYVRGDSLSEFYAFVFFPLILWALDGVRDSGFEIADSDLQSVTRTSICSLQVAVVALAFAGLVLSHNLSALIFTPFALLYLAVSWLRKGISNRSLVIGHWSLVLGLLLSAWVWVPTLAEKDIVQTGTLTEGYFHYTRHFRTTDLVQRHPLFDYSVAPGGDAPSAMGLVQAICAGLGVLVLTVRCLRGGHRRPRWGFVLLGLLISTAMITPLSKPLWDQLPLLATIQFPWRFLSVQALFTAAATAALVPVESTSHSSQLGSRNLSGLLDRLRPRWIAPPIAACLMLSVLLPLRPERLPIGPADVTTDRLRLYELFSGNIGTTIRYEYLYQAAIPRPFTSGALIEPNAPSRPIPLDGASVEGVLIERRPTRQVWQVQGEGGGIAFPLLYWPGWRALVDGKSVEAWPVEGSGYLALEVQPGEHTVLLHLGRTPVRAAAEAMSLVAAVALFALAIKDRIRKPRRQKPKAKSPIFRSVVGHWPLVILPLLVVLSLTAGSPPLSGAFDGQNDLTMDFDQMPYLHHNPGGVNFDGVGRLAGYTLSTEELAPGDTLTVTADWSYIDGPATAMVRLLSPAAVRHEVEPLAETTCKLEGAGRHAVALHIPEDIPRGVYLLQLRLFGPEGELRARTSRGRTRGALYLQPVRVPRGPSLPREISVLAPFGPAIRLHATTITQSAPDRLVVQLVWSTTRPVAANYGISLRLLNAEGQRRMSLDTQPGYGFLPTSLWRPGEQVTDRYILAVPQDLPPGDGYHLEAILYQVPTLEVVGQARLGDFTLPLETPFEARRPDRTFYLQPLDHRLEVDLGGEVRLAGYDLEREGSTLRLTLWWQALRTPQADYTVFAHLFDPATEAIVAQSDAMPQEGAYPTSWWVPGEVVSETVTLSLDGVRQGTYQLAVGLYDWTATRLRAIGPDGRRLPDDRVIPPASIDLSP